MFIYILSLVIILFTIFGRSYSDSLINSIRNGGFYLSGLRPPFLLRRSNNEFENTENFDAALSLDSLNDLIDEDFIMPIFGPYPLRENRIDESNRPREENFESFQGRSTFDNIIKEGVNLRQKDESGKTISKAFWTMTRNEPRSLKEKEVKNNLSQAFKSFVQDSNLLQKVNNELQNNETVIANQSDVEQNSKNNENMMHQTISLSMPDKMIFGNSSKLDTNLPNSVNLTSESSNADNDTSTAE